MIKKITSILLLFLTGPFLVYGECTLNEVPSPPIDSYTKNMDTLIEAVKDAASASQCVVREGSSASYKIAFIINSVMTLLYKVHAVTYKLASQISDSRYYFDSSGTMQLPIFQEHQKSILDIQKKITETAILVGSLCADGDVIFDHDVEMEGSQYKTKGFNLEEVLTEMYTETTHVLIFYRNLASQISDREYIDETHFPIAPAGFSGEMRQFFSSENIQACHNEDPKNQQIKKVIKDAFTTGWKYPQAIQIWKEAFQLLLYRSHQLVGGGETDAGKEAQITKIIEAKKGDIGNSRVLNGKNLTEEFKNNLNGQSIREWSTVVARSIAYEVFGKQYSQAVSDIKEEKKDVGAVNAPTFPEKDADATALAALDKENYADYYRRYLRVGEDKSRNQDLSVGLVNALREIENMSPLVREMAKTICEAYDKQGKNVQEIFGIADCSYFFKA